MACISKNFSGYFNFGSSFSFSSKEGKAQPRIFALLQSKPWTKNYIHQQDFVQKAKFSFRINLWTNI
jgi:hypothetical protein